MKGFLKIKMKSQISRNRGALMRIIFINSSTRLFPENTNVFLYEKADMYGLSFLYDLFQIACKQTDILFST